MWRRRDVGAEPSLSVMLTRDSSARLPAKLSHASGASRQAYGDFGKGSGHPAGLNFGDCLALALDLREPLLWKGDDFGHTGIQSALDG
jgi:uncharacterized protein with PIN domain